MPILSELPEKFMFRDPWNNCPFAISIIGGEGNIPSIKIELVDGGAYTRLGTFSARSLMFPAFNSKGEVNTIPSISKSKEATVY
jgi:hypothetical protein